MSAGACGAGFWPPLTACRSLSFGLMGLRQSLDLLYDH